MEVGIFFYVNGHFLFHGCPLEQAERYGDFLIFPDSHFDIWDQYYIRKYRVDFDYYPRGRVAYRVSTQTYQILYDRCIGDEIRELSSRYGQNVTLGFDEHYQCRRCNAGYVNFGD